MTTRLTNERKNYLKSYARRKLGLRFNAPLKKILSELETTEDLFYPYMEEYVRLNDAVIREELNTIVQADRAKKDAINAKRREKARLIREAKKVKSVYEFTKPYAYDVWRNILAQFLGKHITMSLKRDDGTVVEEHEYLLPETMKALQAYAREAWYGKMDWHLDSDTLMFQIDGSKVVVTVGHRVKKSPVAQSYAEGKTNCLLTPIKNWIDDKIADVQNKRSRERYITMRNKVDKYLEKYTSGVPDSDLGIITNDLQVSISIELPFQSTPYIISKPDTKSYTSFKFMNTRYNHVDQIIDLGDRVTCSVVELGRIMTDMDERGVSYYYTMNNVNVNRVYTNGRIYETSTKYREFISKFETEHDIQGWKIDAVAQPELTRFITNSCHYNEMMDINTRFDKTKMKHIDQAQCYKNFTSCKYYSGFVTKITDFRVTDKIQGQGIYQITNIVIHDAKFKKWNEVLNIYVDGNSYPLPALKFLDTVGSYTVLGGCWGVSGVLNLDYFTDESCFIDKDEGVPYYSKYIGACNHISLTKKYHLNGTVETASCIRANTECEVTQFGVSQDAMWRNEVSKITVYTKKAHSYHLSHVTAFVLEYARLNIIEQLMTMPYESVVRINSDGIYYVADEVCECVNNYREKLSEVFNMTTGLFSTYYESNELCSNIFYEMPVYPYGPYRDFYMSELALGGGGSGKTHFNLTDTGSLNIMYIAPSWKLARNKASEYGCRVGTHASLLMCDPTNDNFKYANVLVLDEVSMLSNEAKNKILDYYGSRYKIIFCGDIKYQLPFIGEGVEFNKERIDHVMTFDVDYRAQCSVLKQLKSDCRELMDMGVMLCPESLFQKLSTVTVSQVDSMYKIDDMILCQYHKNKDEYTTRFTGRFSSEKYYITDSSRLYSRGDIIISNEKIASEFKPEIRHSFTVHSIQGETCRTKLFIHKARMSMRMFYTAISRAQSLSQIFLILN
jgi:hypothetical protein